MANEKPNYRISKINVDSLEAGIVSSVILRNKTEKIGDKTFWGCSCEEYEPKSCTCNTQCKCDKECHYCYCDDDCSSFCPHHDIPCTSECGDCVCVISPN